MRGRLNVEKVNAAINDMATYAEANAQLLTAQRKKVCFLCFIGFIVLYFSSFEALLMNMHFFHEALRKSIGKSFGKKSAADGYAFNILMVIVGTCFFFLFFISSIGSKRNSFFTPSAGT